MIKNLIERNKSVFVIGLLTLTIFMSIIIISEVRRVRRGNDSPKLIRIENEVETSDTTSAEGNSKEENNSNLSVLDSVYSEVDKGYGILLIEYTSKGFVPNYAKAILGQKVKWVNKTGISVYIAQNTPFFDEFKTPLLLPANGALEFRLYKDGKWKYQNPEAGFSGDIEILKP
jgi:hypothetical protein